MADQQLSQVAAVPTTPQRLPSQPAHDNSVTPTNSKKKLKLRGWAKTLSHSTARLLIGAAKDDVDEVQIAIGEGADINAKHKDKDDNTALHFAAASPAPEMLFEVLNFRPQLLLNGLKQTPVHVAAAKSASPMAVPLIVMAFGLPDAMDAKGNTVLHSLMENIVLTPQQLLHLAEWILQYKDGHLLLNARNKSAMTVLDAAINRAVPDGELHQLLLLYGARQGHELDLGNRELLIHNERRSRNTLVQKETDSFGKIIRWHTSRQEEIQLWERFARRQWRLIEKEEGRRSLLAQEQNAQFAALLWALETEQSALRKMAHVMLEDRSATRIQAKWRMVLSKKVANLRRTESIQRHSAATKIQKVFRGKLSREEYQRIREEHLACKAIQRCFRKFLAKKENQRLRQHLTEKENVAALTIQTGWRKHQYEKRLAEKDKKAYEATVAWVNEQTAALNFAATTIQRCFRMNLDKNKYRHERKNVIKIQSLWRGKKDRQWRDVLMKKRIATDRIMKAFQERATMARLRSHINELLELRYKERVDHTGLQVIKLIASDQFYDYITNQRPKARRAAQIKEAQQAKAAPKKPSKRIKTADRSLYKKTDWRKGLLLGKYDQSLNLFAMIVLLLAYVSMVFYPRSEASSTATHIDIAVVVFLWIRLLFIKKTWSIAFDIILVILATAFLAAGIHHAGIVYSLMLLKAPFFLPQSIPEVRFFCVSIEYSLYIFCSLLPFIACGVLLATRFLLNDGNCFQGVNVGSVLLFLTSTNASIPHATHVSTGMADDAEFLSANFSGAEGVSQNMLQWAKADWEHWGALHEDNNATAVLSETVLPLPEQTIAVISFYFGIITSVCIGVSTAAKQYFEGEHRLKHDTRKLADYSLQPDVVLRRPETLADAEDTLADDWQKAVSSAKDAIEASHNEHLHNIGMLPEAKSRQFIADVTKSMRNPRVEAHAPFKRHVSTLFNTPRYNDVRQQRKKSSATEQTTVRRKTSRSSSTGSNDRQQQSPRQQQQGSTEVAEQLRYNPNVVISSEDDESSYDHRGNTVSAPRQSVPNVPSVLQEAALQQIQQQQQHRQEMTSEPSSPMTNVHASFEMEDERTRILLKSWDVRNEDVGSRWSYDLSVLDVALGRKVHRPATVAFFQRQWRGPIHYRETTILLLVAIVLSGVFPDNYIQEAIFSGIFTLELIFSIKVLGLGYVIKTSRGVSLLFRLFGIVVGFVPDAIPYASLRAVRLLEGWSFVFTISRFHSMSIFLCAYLALASYGVATMSILQGREEMSEEESAVAAIANYTDVLVPVANHTHNFCDSTGDCFKSMAQIFFIPYNAPLHTFSSADHKMGIATTMILVFRFLLVPFILCHLLHPITQVSLFVNRFLCQTVKEMTNDLVKYMSFFCETESWYSRRKWFVGRVVHVTDDNVEILRCVTPSIATKMKAWLEKARHNIRMRSSYRRRQPLTHSTVTTYTSAIRRLYIIARAKFAFPSKLESRDASHGTKSSSSTVARRRSGDKASATVRSPLKTTVAKVLRMMPLHMIHCFITLLSIAMLWASPRSPLTSDNTAFEIAVIVIHAISIFTALVLIPGNMGCFMTIASVVSLLVALSMSTDATAYALRHISHLRLLQLHVGPFGALQRANNSMFNIGTRSFFVFAAAGTIAYVVQLLRSHHMHSYVGEISNTVPLLDVAHNATFYTNVSISDPNGTKSEAIRSQLKHNFEDDAQELYLIYCHWILPAITISTFYAFLRFTNAHLIHTLSNHLMHIPKLEDPSRSRKSLFLEVLIYAVDPVITVVNLGFITACKESVLSYLPYEIFSIIAMTILSAVRVISGVRRLRYRAPAPESIRIDSVLLGCEVAGFGLVLWGAICILSAIIVSGSDNDYSTVDPQLHYEYALNLRYLLLLRYTPRLIKVSFIHRWRYVVGGIIFAIATLLIIGAMDAEMALADVNKDAFSGDMYWDRIKYSSSTLLRYMMASELPKHVEYPSAYTISYSVDADGSLVEEERTLTPPVGTLSVLLLCCAIIFKAVGAAVIGFISAILLEKSGCAMLIRLPTAAQRVYDFVGNPKNLHFCAFAGELSVAMAGSCGNKQRIDAQRIVHDVPDLEVWMLPHIFETLGIINPARQRNTMWNVCQSIDFLQIMDRRRQRVKRFMKSWHEYSDRGPGTVPFEELPCYPPQVRNEDRQGYVLQRNPDGTTSRVRANANSVVNIAPERRSTNHGSDDDDQDDILMAPTSIPSLLQERRSHHVPALRVVQAVAAHALGYPSTTSIEAKMWFEFVQLQRKVRAAVLIQSLWRMFTTIEEFEFGVEHTRGEIIALRFTRKRLRLLKLRKRMEFFSHPNLEHALNFGESSRVYNPSDLHKLILDRLRNGYDELNVPTATYGPFQSRFGESHDIRVNPAFFRSDGAFPARYLQSGDITYDVSEPQRTSPSVTTDDRTSDRDEEDDDDDEEEEDYYGRTVAGVDDARGAEEQKPSGVAVRPAATANAEQQRSSMTVQQPQQVDQQGRSDSTVEPQDFMDVPRQTSLPSNSAVVVDNDNDDEDEYNALTDPQAMIGGQISGTFAMYAQHATSHSVDTDEEGDDGNKEDCPAQPLQQVVPEQQAHRLSAEQSSRSGASPPNVAASRDTAKFDS